MLGSVFNYPFNLDQLKEEYGSQAIAFRPGSDVIFPLHGTFIMAKHRAWQEPLNLMLARILETGLVQKAIHKHIDYSGYEGAGEFDGLSQVADPFTLDHVASGFIVLVFGLLLATLSSTVEVYGKAAFCKC